MWIWWHDIIIVVRTILYGVLGFFVFGIVGILIAATLYPTGGQNSLGIIGEIILGSAIMGAILSGWFGWWMTIEGERRLENFQNKPQTMWGVIGAIFGLWVLSFFLKLFITENARPYEVALSLLALIIWPLLCGWAAIQIARFFGLSNSDLTQKTWAIYASNTIIFLIFFYLFLKLILSQS
jgi:uncharacterized membrane protein YeaQ/YmgE (transglycosylase-associated protein family)